MSHPLACSFCMRSTPISLVLLSFPHNRSLSFYSPLLNWSILHLNQDISTTGKERGKNKYKRASWVDGDTGTLLFSSFGQNICAKKNKRWKYLKVLDDISSFLVWASVPQRDQYTFQSSEERYHNKSSHQEQGKYANPITIYIDNCWGVRKAAGLLIEA